jgi:hypothetical protein
MEAFPEKQTVVKLHPSFWREYEDLVLSIADELHIADDIFVTKDYLWELLDICDLVITEGSTVGQKHFCSKSL